MALGLPPPPPRPRPRDSKTFKLLNGKLVYALTPYLNLWVFFLTVFLLSQVGLNKNIIILSVIKPSRSFFSQGKITHNMSHTLHLLVLERGAVDIQESPM